MYIISRIGYLIICDLVTAKHHDLEYMSSYNTGGFCPSIVGYTW